MCPWLASHDANDDLTPCHLFVSDRRKTLMFERGRDAQLADKNKIAMVAV